MSPARRLAEVFRGGPGCVRRARAPASLTCREVSVRGGSWGCWRRHPSELGDRKLQTALVGSPPLGNLSLRVSQPHHLGARGSGRMREALRGPGPDPGGGQGQSPPSVPSQLLAPLLLFQFFPQQTRSRFGEPRVLPVCAGRCVSALPGGLRRRKQGGMA